MESLQIIRFAEFKFLLQERLSGLSLMSRKEIRWLEAKTAYDAAMKLGKNETYFPWEKFAS